jgi:hypothetical protein
MTIHAQALNLVDDSCALFVSLLRTGLCDLAAHILKKVLRKALVF